MRSCAPRRRRTSRNCRATTVGMVKQDARRGANITSLRVAEWHARTSPAGVGARLSTLRATHGAEADLHRVDAEVKRSGGANSLISSYGYRIASPSARAR
jgi:hypothetical protein